MQTRHNENKINNPKNNGFKSIHNKNQFVKYVTSNMTKYFKEKMDQINLAEDLEFWMTKLPPTLRSIPIIHLAIPGSHDSFTSSITNQSEISPDAEQIIRDFKFLGPVLRTVMSHWSRTQQYNVTEQLKSGIRYFDLRIATKKQTNRLFFVHGLYSDECESVLREIQQFLDTHPQEVVILDCQHFYGFTIQDHEYLMCLLTTIFGPKTLPYTSHMEHLTLEYLTSQFHYQIITIYRSDQARFGQPLLWPSCSFPTPWPDTIDIPKLFEILNNGLKTRNFHVGFVSQCVLTPTKSFILKYLFSCLKKQCVEPLETSKYRWLANNKPGKGGINIVISDFIDMDNCNFPKQVINLNKKLMDI